MSTPATHWLLLLLGLLAGSGGLLWLLVRPRFRHFGPASVCIPAHLDREQRMAVWSALSQLYLDTQLSTEDQRGIAASLAGSPYSVEQLERILFCELHGLLVHNLLSVAGEWVAFDMEAIAADLIRRSLRSSSDRPTWRLILAPELVDTEWQAIRCWVVESRAQQLAASG